MTKHPIDIALQIATKAHEGQKDRDGYPVILHPITVGMMGDTDDAQKTETERLMDILRAKGYEVNTLLYPLREFWISEEYHQRYYEKTGGEPYCHFRTKKF